ncbi:hypothetical protein PUNSTDRAFT_54540 [Punctularia strigosozonata HHB-11173 SS5]|uniref:uncharacterized protein n=1 Tax=Punctularia strigosozonata (strain HHB-11173) TaxID=741275 RepID=UPI0004417DA1|nr:uncharacterized protein PUNSTDRAFT_54540 [Punctularia strigosozonata HHB-11173 SS5]EIN06317.1 hypothetical protein PUNSTDRAFT_54540 [Punctularia strigosozonata HHB-11173 SS5]
MCQEWGATNLICTVLISATVAVLAIPEINGVVQTTAILSILCSIASVCLGSFLLWVNQSLMDNDSLVTFADFARAKALRVFPRLLAFILSIPLAMMLYALMFFLVSIMAYSVDSGIAGVSRTFRRTTEWIAVGVAGLILVFALITGVTFTDRGMHFFRWRREMKGKIGEKWKAWKAPRRGATRGDAEDRGENGEDAMSERKDPGATTPQPDLEIGPSTYRQ